MQNTFVKIERDGKGNKPTLMNGLGIRDLGPKLLLITKLNEHRRRISIISFINVHKITLLIALVM